MRDLFPLALFVSFLPACASGSEPSAETGRPPSFLFIVVDDLGWTDLGCYGSSFYETPNVDSLAQQGWRFTDAYATCPVCSPTRASLMTGQYPQRFAITDYISPTGTNQPELWKRNTPLLPAQYSDRLEHDVPTLADALADEGYATFFAGKWHLGPEGYWPEDQGFDVNRGGIDRGGPYGGKKYFSPYGNPRLTDGPDGEHLPARLAAETVEFVRAHADEPFLAYLSFYSVHTPLMARADLRTKYEAKRSEAAPETWGREGRREVREVQNHAVYAGMVEAMDEAVGVVLAALDELGLADDTVVVFTSDNGGLSTSEGHPTSNLPLRGGKGWLYEGGVRVPLIVRWPGGADAARECGVPVMSADLYPTLLELAGAPAPRLCDGTSLTALRAGASELDRDAIFWHYPHYGNQGGSPGAALRAGRWKLIEFFGDDGRVELYDLASDPSESTDLAWSRPELTEELRARLHRWQESVGARRPTQNPAYEP